MKLEAKKVNLRQAQAEERRLQILDTALKVFAARGFAGASVKDIAEEAGISQGLLYHYFTGKEDLLLATIDYHGFLPELRRILKDTGKLPVEQVLKEIANGFLNMLEQKQMLVSILMREVQVNPEVASAWANLCREGVAILQPFLEARVAGGELRPHNSEVTARSLFGLLFMFHFTRNVFQNSRVTRAQFIEEVLNNTLKGIGRV